MTIINEHGTVITGEKVGYYLQPSGCVIACTSCDTPCSHGPGFTLGFEDGLCKCGESRFKVRVENPLTIYKVR